MTRSPRRRRSEDRGLGPRPVRSALWISCGCHLPAAVAVVEDPCIGGGVRRILSQIMPGRSAGYCCEETLPAAPRVVG